MINASKGKTGWLKC